MTEAAPLQATPMTGRERPVFLLSFRQRDELAALAAGAGWRVVAARRSDGAERRLLASGASVAVVDARGAVEEGLAAVRALAGVAGATGGALLALVSRNDSARLGEFYEAGATHFLASPMRDTRASSAPPVAPATPASARTAASPSPTAPRASTTATAAPLASNRRSAPSARRAATTRQPARAASPASSSR